MFNKRIIEVLQILVDSGVAQYVSEDRIEGAFDEEDDAIHLDPSDYELFCSFLHYGNEHIFCDGFHEFVFIIKGEHEKK